jgi:hypothetical protein
MSDTIPIKLAEAALDAQEKQHQAEQYISKASFDEAWMLYQRALEEGQQLKAQLAQLQAQPISPALTLAKQLAELTERKGLFYSKEYQAQADAIIKQIRSL